MTRRFFSRGVGVLRAVLASAAVTAVMASSFAAAEVVNRVVAVVNDEIITLFELEAAVAVAKGGFKGDMSERRDVELRSSVLDGLIEAKLIKIYSARVGIDVSEKEIDNAIEDVKRQNNATHETLIMMLSNSGITYKEYRDQMREDIRRSKFIGRFIRSKVNMSDEDVRDYYYSNLDRFRTGEEVRLRVLFLSGAMTDKDNAAKVEAIRVAMAAGEDFASLVKRYSDGGHGDKSGDMGYIKRNELSDDYVRAIEGLNVGGVAGPVSSSGGVYFFSLMDARKGGAVPFDEVKGKLADELYSKLLRQKYEFWLDDIKKVSSIEIRL